MVAVHVAAACCVAMVLPGLAGTAIAALLVGLGGATAWDRALLRHRDSIRSLLIEGPQTMRLITRNGAEAAVQVAARRYVSRLAVILSMRHGTRRTIVVACNMLDVESFRRLRLWAMWGRVLGVAPEQLRT